MINKNRLTDKLYLEEYTYKKIMTFLYSFLNILLPQLVREEIIGDLYELQDELEISYGKWKTILIFLKLGIESSLLLRFMELKTALNNLVTIFEDRYFSFMKYSSSKFQQVFFVILYITYVAAAVFYLLDIRGNLLQQQSLVFIVTTIILFSGLGMVIGLILGFTASINCRNNKRINL